jgi:hypothetical protein
LYKKTRAKLWCNRAGALKKNGSRHWVGAGMREEIKIINIYIYIYIYRLTARNLTKRAKGIYKKVSNI